MKRHLPRFIRLWIARRRLVRIAALKEYSHILGK